MEPQKGLELIQVWPLGENLPEAARKYSENTNPGHSDVVLFHQRKLLPRGRAVCRRLPLQTAKWMGEKRRCAKALVAGLNREAKRALKGTP